MGYHKDCVLPESDSWESDFLQQLGEEEEQVSDEGVGH